MTGRAKRTKIWLAAVVAGFVGSGVAGAFVNGTVFDVGPHQAAKLGGTRLYCQSGVDKTVQARAFFCGTDQPNGGLIKGSYGITMSQKGVEVETFGNGVARPVRWFRSLRTQTSTAKDAVFDVKDGEIAQLAGTALSCASQLTKNVRTYGCAVGDVTAGTVRPRTYSLLFNQRGVTVLRIGSDGKTYSTVRQWSNP